jgi:hypothetical protein
MPGRLSRTGGKLNQRGRLLFVNKKKQKNFVELGPCRFSATGPKSKKFLRRFFQKAATFLS